MIFLIVTKDSVRRTQLKTHDHATESSDQPAYSALWKLSINMLVLIVGTPRSQKEHPRQ